MTALMRGELIKAATTRTWLAYTALGVVLAAATVIIGSLTTDVVRVSDKQGVISGWPVVLLLFGLVGAAGEYRHRTAAPAALVAGRDRGVLLLARMGAYALAGLAVATLMTAVSLALGLPLLSGEPGPGLGAGDVVAARRYHEIRVADVLAVSGVSRSTFYEHFSSKDELLSASMERLFVILAGMIDGQSSAKQVQALLEHFWENRALAPSLFQGATFRAIRRKLISCIEARLESKPRNRLKIPRRLVAHALADGMFSPIVAWLMGEAVSNAEDLAVALRRSTAAFLDGFVPGV